MRELNWLVLGAVHKIRFINFTKLIYANSVCKLCFPLKSSLPKSYASTTKTKSDRLSHFMNCKNVKKLASPKANET